MAAGSLTLQLVAEMQRKTQALMGALLMAAPLVAVMDAAGATGVVGTDAPSGYAELSTSLHGVNVTGEVLLEGTVTATDGWDVTQVLVWLDDQLVGRVYPTSEGTWSFPLDTTHLADGAHTVELCGMVAPSGAPGLVTLNGDGDAVTFRSSNANADDAVTLFESTVRLSGASATPWTFLVDQPYTGLRVSVQPTADMPPVPGAFAQVVVKYHAPGSAGVALGGQPRVVLDPAHVWVASYGGASAVASSTARSDAAIAPGGVLSLDGVFAGFGGAVTVRVEALPVE